MLLVRRSDSEDHLPGVWSLPGGKVERGASCDDILERALAREIREEVGVSVTEITYLESKLFYIGDGPSWMWCSCAGIPVALPGRGMPRRLPMSSGSPFRRSCPGTISAPGRKGAFLSPKFGWNKTAVPEVKRKDY